MAFLKKVPRRGHDYYLIAEAYRNEKGEPRHRTLANVGRIDDPKVIERIRTKLKHGFQLEDIHTGHSLMHGNVACLLQVVKERGLIELIDSQCPKSNGLKVGLTTCLLAINRLITEASKAKMNFADWLQKTSLPELTDVQLELLSCENICNMMDYLDVDTCLAIDKARTEATPEIDITEGLQYDITSTFTFGHCNTMAERGYSRDHRGDQEQVVIGLLVDKNKIPITSHVEPGNTTDIKQFPVMVQHLLPKFGLRKVTLIVDRGMISEKNINKVVDELGYGIIIMMRNSDNVTQQALVEARKRNLHVLKKAQGIEGGNLKGDVRGVSIVQQVYGRHRKLLVCHNSISALQMAARRGQRLARAEASLNTLKEKLSQRSRDYDKVVLAVDKILTKLKRFIQVDIVAKRERRTISFELMEPGSTVKEQTCLARYEEQMLSLQDSLVKRESYSASEDFIDKQLEKILGEDRDRFKISLKMVKLRPTISWAVDYDEVKVAEKDDGWFVLMASDLEAPAEEILAAYEDKDGIEKAFRSLKSVIDLRPLFHHKTDRVMTHIWICMLAQYIRRMFELKMKDAGIEMSFEKAIEQLSQVYWNELEAEVIEGVRIHWNTQTNKLNHDQRALLSAFGAESILKN